MDYGELLWPSSITGCGYLVAHCTSFEYSAPSRWNSVQGHLKMTGVITLGELKSVLNDLENRRLSQCLCYLMLCFYL